MGAKRKAKKEFAKEQELAKLRAKSAAVERAKAAKREKRGEAVAANAARRAALSPEARKREDRTMLIGLAIVVVFIGGCIVLTRDDGATDDAVAETAREEATDDGEDGQAEGEDADEPSEAGGLLLNTEVVGWQICSEDPEQVYLEAGTRSPTSAAHWYSLGSTGDHRSYAKRGCLAGLLGEPPPAEHCEQQPNFYGCPDEAAIDAEAAAWRACADDPERIFREAGTRDPEQAAEHYAEIDPAGWEVWPDSVRGCLAGLTGGPRPAG